MQHKSINELIERYPKLESVKSKIETVIDILKECYDKEGTLYLCGNGGSASDSEHIVGELMKGFLLNRELSKDLKTKINNELGSEGKVLADNLQQGLRAISLTSHPSLLTAFSNDVHPELIFAQQLSVLGKKGDVVLGITTSGNSKNVVKALEIGKVLGLKTIALTGEKGGKCLEFADCTINVPETETYIVQEYHLPIYHAICATLEDIYFE